MDIRQEILRKIQKGGQVRPSEIVEKSGFSRVYVNRFFRGLVADGLIIPLGRTNTVHYVSARPAVVRRARLHIMSSSRRLRNSGLNEDLVLDDIKRSTGIFIGLKATVAAILDYSFMKMLNNAIEHSRSREIRVSIKRQGGLVRFNVDDRGIGAFRNIMRQHGLSSELEAIDFVLKGKQTTDPKSHSGEGIFFTSKAGDVFTLQSGRKKLTVNNLIDDIIISDVKATAGTRVSLTIGEKSDRDLRRIFRKYSDQAYRFTKTRVLMRLYEIDTEYLSRSQARRVVAGLEKFKTITLDFQNVRTVGQAFADEVFRVFQQKHPRIKLQPVNMNQNIRFMIARATRRGE